MNLSLFLKIIGIIIIIYLIVVLYVYFKQRSLLYVPNIDNYSDEELIINVDEVFIENSDGNKLRSVFFKNPNNTNNTLLMFHGNAGPIENRFYKLNKLSKYNQNILLISWRSYSGNEGSPTEKGLYDDAISAVKWLQNKGYKKEDIIIYGESLGTAVSIEIAQNEPFKGLILEAPFTSMVDAAKFHYPYLPVSWMLKDRYMSKDKIKNIITPLLILHAKGDTIVPFWMGEKMYELANEPKMNYFIDENEHLVTYDDELMNMMDNFYKLISVDG